MRFIVVEKLASTDAVQCYTRKVQEGEENEKFWKKKVVDANNVR